MIWKVGGEKKKNWCKHGIAWIAWIVPNLLDRQLAGKLVSGGYLLYVSTYRFAAWIWRANDFFICLSLVSYVELLTIHCSLIFRQADDVAATCLSTYVSQCGTMLSIHIPSMQPDFQTGFFRSRYEAMWCFLSTCKAMVPYIFTYYDQCSPIFRRAWNAVPEPIRGMVRSACCSGVYAAPTFLHGHWYFDQTRRQHKLSWNGTAHNYTCCRWAVTIYMLYCKCFLLFHFKVAFLLMWRRLVGAPWTWL